MNASFREIFDNVPLGTIVAFSDGTPRPPDRFKRKLSDWENRNGKGRLVSKKGAEDRSRNWDVDRFTLNTANYGSDGLIALARSYALQRVPIAEAFKRASEFCRNRRVAAEGESE